MGKESLCRGKTRGKKVEPATKNRTLKVLIV